MRRGLLPSPWRLRPSLSFLDKQQHVSFSYRQQWISTVGTTRGTFQQQKQRPAQQNLFPSAFLLPGQSPHIFHHQYRSYIPLQPDQQSTPPAQDPKSILDGRGDVMYQKDQQDDDDNNNNNKNFDDWEEIVLYQRNHSRLALTRTMFGFFSFHSAVWIWYSAYFLPSFVFDDPNLWQVDPLVPAGGLTFAAFLQFVGTVYPLRLMAKLSLWRPRPDDLARTTQSSSPPQHLEAPQLLLYKYTFPFISLNQTPQTLAIGELTMNPQSKETVDVLAECDADLSQYVGHVTVQGPIKWFPYMMDIREPDDVPQPELLLEAILQADRIEATPLSKKKKVGPSPRLYNARRRPTSSLRPRPESKLKSIVRKRTR